MLLKHKGAIHGPWAHQQDCMGYQAAPHGSLGLPSGLYQFMSHTVGTALLLEFALARPQLPTPYITGTAKKPAAFK